MKLRQLLSRIDDLVNEGNLDKELDIIVNDGHDLHCVESENGHLKLIVSGINPNTEDTVEVEELSYHEVEETIEKEPVEEEVEVENTETEAETETIEKI